MKAYIRKFICLCILLSIFKINGVCQSKDTAHPATFRIKAPAIKAVWSESNTLYIGDNPLIIKGLDSSDADKYYLKCPTAFIKKFNGTYYITIYDGNYRDTAPGNLKTVSIAGPRPLRTVTVYLCKISGRDTNAISSQVFNLHWGGKPRFYKKIGDRILTGNKVESKYFIKHPAISMIISDPNDDKDTTVQQFCKDFKVSELGIKICNKAYRTYSDSLSKEMIDAIFWCKTENVLIDYIEVIGVDGIPFRLTSDGYYK